MSTGDAGPMKKWGMGVLEYENYTQLRTNMKMILGAKSRSGNICEGRVHQGV